MKVRYQGFEIGARREKTPMGTRVICFYARRLVDDWHLFSGATGPSKSVRTVLEEVKERVGQAILTDGKSECLDEIPWILTSPAEERPASLPSLILILRSVEEMEQEDK